MGKKQIWALLDDRIGNRNQVLGVAEALLYDFEVKEIFYSKFSFLPNIFSFITGSNIDLDGNPDIIISAGRRSARIAKYIKQKTGAFIVQIMWPDMNPKYFDLVILPLHDDKHQGKNIFHFAAAPNRITDYQLMEAKAKWEDEFLHLPKPWIALLVGGSNKSYQFTRESAAEFVHLAKSRAGQGSLLITSSRRTDAHLKELLRKIGGRNYLYQYGDEGENPYMGYLACADEIIVSGDSVAMCSESCSTGKPVLIYDKVGVNSKKFRKFYDILIGNNYACSLTKENIALQFFPDNRLDTAGKIADLIWVQYANYN